MSELKTQNNLIGKKFNRLTIVGEAPCKVFPSCRKTQVEAMCECGKLGTYVLSAIKNGNTKSCGCYNIDRISSHGMSDTRQYQIWADMKTRCDNIKNPWYDEYGGRGITYAIEWKSFENFWDDMKESYEDNLTLDRIDNDGNYCKENCRWANKYYQSHNQRKSRNAKNKYIGTSKAKGCNHIGSRIKYEGKIIGLGKFITEEEGAKAYDDASEILYGLGDRPNKTTPCDDHILEQVKSKIEQSKAGIKKVLTGEDFSNSKLNESKVIEILELLSVGEMTQKEIAKLYGVGQYTISAIKRNAIWKSVERKVKNNP